MSAGTGGPPHREDADEIGASPWPDAPAAPAPGAHPHRLAAAIGPFLADEAALTAWGRRIGAEVDVPLVLALRGELGAGKSVLARAVARGAGVAGHLPSPTFNLLYRYDSARGVGVVHTDLYRLEAPDDVWELGWAEFGAGAEIVLVEWPERAEALLPPDRWDIHLDIPEDRPELRRVTALRRGHPPVLPPSDHP